MVQAYKRRPKGMAVIPSGTQQGLFQKTDTDDHAKGGKGMGKAKVQGEAETEAGSQQESLANVVDTAHTRPSPQKPGRAPRNQAGVWYLQDNQLLTREHTKQNRVNTQHKKKAGNRF